VHLRLITDTDAPRSVVQVGEKTDEYRCSCRLARGSGWGLPV